jgi:hypothetical protein
LVGLLRRADLAAEQVVDSVQGAVVLPLVELPPDGALGREVLGEIPPLTARAKDGEDGVDDIPPVGRAGTSAGVNGDVGLDQGPLRVGDVAGVMLRSHSTFYASHPLWDRL